MNSDELAAALFAEFGYLVLGTNKQRAIGEVLPELRGLNGVSAVPRVIGKTNKADYLRQLSRSRDLCPQAVKRSHDPCAYYYRVEATD